MDMRDVTAALSALGHEGRLATFRLLVEAGSEGRVAGDIARALGMAPNTLSTNLSILARAGLVAAERRSRFVIYRARLERMATLLGFLIEDTCGGSPGLFGALIDIIEAARRPDGGAVTE